MIKVPESLLTAFQNRNKQQKITSSGIDIKSPVSSTGFHITDLLDYDKSKAKHERVNNEAAEISSA